jgi:hypothetical protein
MKAKSLVVLGINGAYMEVLEMIQNIEFPKNFFLVPANVRVGCQNTGDKSN